MIGHRARIGFLVPPGNPTVEPEMFALAPPGVSVHFHRMTASGTAGVPEGQDERIRSQIASLDEGCALLGMLSPRVIVMAHTATSYSLKEGEEAALVARLERISGARVVTAFGAVLAALAQLGVTRIAYATPYAADLTERGRQHLERCGITVVNAHRLEHVRNIYDETNARAYTAGRDADRPEAQAVFLSGVGMPTIDMLQELEDDLGKPVLSAASAMMWQALRVAGVRTPVTGRGRLLQEL
jgi:maleate cis-trans isomerase